MSASLSRQIKILHWHFKTVVENSRMLKPGNKDLNKHVPDRNLGLNLIQLRSSTGTLVSNSSGSYLTGQGETANEWPLMLWTNCHRYWVPRAPESQ